MNQDKQAKLEDKFIGCLLGGAIGDALGFTSECLKRPDFKTINFIFDYAGD
jgi:ADP-ribosylglycohydrolase